MIPFLKSSWLALILMHAVFFKLVAGHILTQNVLPDCCNYIKFSVILQHLRFPKDYVFEQGLHQIESCFSGLILTVLSHAWCQHLVFLFFILIFGGGLGLLELAEAKAIQKWSEGPCSCPE